MLNADLWGEKGQLGVVGAVSEYGLGSNAHTSTVRRPKSIRTGAVRISDCQNLPSRRLAYALEVTGSNCSPRAGAFRWRSLIFRWRF